MIYVFLLVSHNWHGSNEGADIIESYCDGVTEKIRELHSSVFLNPFETFLFVVDAIADVRAIVIIAKGDLRKAFATD